MKPSAFGLRPTKSAGFPPVRQAGFDLQISMHCVFEIRVSRIKVEVFRSRNNKKKLKKLKRRGERN